MVIEISEQLGAALKAQALIRGVSADGYACEVLERELAKSDAVRGPLKTSYGVLAKYGPGISSEEIEENRAEMFRKFGSD